MSLATSDYNEAKGGRDGEEPGWPHGVVMGRRDWMNIVCRLEPHLMGLRVGMCGRYQVACDTTMDPDASRTYYSRAGYEEHLSRLP